jgi:hypothetical protein
MSDQITTAFVKQFASGITIRAQQQGSNLRQAVDITTGITGDAVYFDQVSATSMSPLGSRHADTVLTDTPHHRRKCPIVPYSVADMIDNPDMVRTLNDPTNAYVRQFGYAAGRQIDDIIIDAFDATVATGVAGAGSDAFDTDFSIAAGTSNLTTDKLRTARKLLEKAENPEDSGDNQWYVVCSAEQREGMLGDSEFQNNDFNSVRALVDGTVDTWLGFKFLKSERLPTDSNNVTSCFAWRKSGMMLAVGSEGKGFIDVMPGKNHSTQVRYALDMGAVRMEQNAVVRIYCDDDL